MSMINPKRIKFENRNDVIDYVARGLPPTKKQYAAFAAAMQNPVAVIDPESKGVQIGTTIVSGPEDDINEILDRVYADRIHNRNIAIGTIGGVLVVTGALLFKGHSDKPEPEVNHECPFMEQVLLYDDLDEDDD